MGGAPLTHPDEIVGDKPEAVVEPDLTPEPEAEQEEDVLAASPLFAPEPQVPPRVEEEEPARPDYAGFTMPTPQAVARSNAQAPKGRLRIDPVKTRRRQQPIMAKRVKYCRANYLRHCWKGWGSAKCSPSRSLTVKICVSWGKFWACSLRAPWRCFLRAPFSSGVKADMTMVLDDANNPFKLLPTGKTVLIQMFGTPMPGFMPPTKSVRDALIDLQAHQLGMISGIRAIIAAMLQSFNPEQLEEQAKQNG